MIDFRTTLAVAFCSFLALDAPSPARADDNANSARERSVLGAVQGAHGLQTKPAPIPPLPLPPKRALVIVVEENQSESQSVSWWGLSQAISGLRPADLLPPNVKTALAPVSTAVNPLLSAANVPGVRVVDDLVGREIRKLVAKMLGDWMVQITNAAGLPSTSCARTSLVNAANQGISLGIDPFEAFIDRVGEAAMSDCLKQMAAPYYTKVEVLTDSGASFSTFKARVKDLSASGYTIDILLDVHGCESPASRNNKSCSNPGLRFSDARALPSAIAVLGDGKKLNINAVYQVACWGSKFNSSWLTTGAKAANGANELNYFVLMSPFVFLDSYTRGGRSLKDAAQAAFDAERRLHEGGPYVVTLSLQPFFDQYLPRGVAGLLPCAGINFNGQVIGYALVRDKSGKTDLCVRQQPIPALPETVSPGCPPTYTKEIRTGADRCLAPDPVAAACGGSRSGCSWSFDIGVRYGSIVNAILGRRYGADPNLPVSPAWSSARVPAGDPSVGR